tara:strand:- start:419 stop:745 length:327 start_codon:yes stop_codon:yes gene_type:complete
MLEWNETVGTLTAKCFYDYIEEEYTVTVTHTDGRAKSVSWHRRGFEPIFGMDMNDQEWSMDKAEELSIKLENEKRLSCGHPVTDDYAYSDQNPGATHFCTSCSKENIQ